MDPVIAIIMFCTVASYMPVTIIITEWRGSLRRDVNRTDQACAAKVTDTLMNYETVCNRAGFDVTWLGIGPYLWDGASRSYLSAAGQVLHQRAVRVGPVRQGHRGLSKGRLHEQRLDEPAQRRAVDHYVPGGQLGAAGELKPAPTSSSSPSLVSLSAAGPVELRPPALLTPRSAWPECSEGS